MRLWARLHNEEYTVSEEPKIERNLLRSWMKAYLATVVGERSENIDTQDPLSAYDLDSIDAVTMALEMEKALGNPVHPEMFLDNNASIDDVIAQHF
jgi:acyl carrier protein